MMNPLRWVVPAAAICLFLSGMAGLVYEVVWTRYLALFLGHTSHAVVAVLVAFMGGLSLGNAWLGSRADRVHRPLVLYAWLEIGIGGYALIFPQYYELCHRLYVNVARAYQPASGGLLALRFAFSLLTILLPAILMGGTLPVLVKLVTRTLGELQARVASLYSANSAGAVAGVLLADFWWIPSLGLSMTVMAAAIINLSIGAALLLANAWLREEASSRAETPSDSPRYSEPSNEKYCDRDLTLAVLGIGLSGFVAMLDEVVWTRLLALALGSTTHAFSLMLATFITGLALGAYWVGRWNVGQRTLAAFGWAELALAVSLGGSMFFYDQLPYWFARLAGVLNRRPEVYPLYALLQALICFGVMLVPTVCLGFTLPLASRIATTELSRTGRSVGRVFSVNTLGTVLGALASGLWLMPRLGMAQTLALGIGVNVVIGLMLVFHARRIWQRRLIWWSPILVAAIVWLAGLEFNQSWQRSFTLGLWLNPNPPANLADFRQRVAAEQILYYRDGAGATVSVHKFREGTNNHLSLKINGKPDASTMLDATTQLLIGHIPLLLHPNPKQALVIGLGSGMTCGAVLQHAPIGRLDVVEISPEVVAGAKLFGPFNHQALDDPKLHLVVEDAKSFLELTDRRYDAILSEPSNPWMPGISSVLSREYYENCRTHLQPGGLMAQWVQTYDMSDAALEMLLATFCSVYPYASVWQTSIADLLIVGSVRPIQVDLNHLEARFHEPRVQADLARIDLLSVPALLARQIISEDNTSFIPSRGTPWHSDYRPRLEYLAQQCFFVKAGTSLPRIYDENASARPATILGQYLRRRPLTESDFLALTLFSSTYHLPQGNLLRSLLARWQHDFPKSLEPVELAAKLADPPPAEELEAFRLAAHKEEILGQAGKDPDLLRYYAQCLMSAYRAQRSAFFLPATADWETILQKLIDADPASQRVAWLWLAELAWDRGDDAACLRYGTGALDPDVSKSGPAQFDLDPRGPARVLRRMIESHWRSGNHQAAWKLCQQAQKYGYTGPSAKQGDAGLDMTYRKVESRMASGRISAHP